MRRDHFTVTIDERTEAATREGRMSDYYGEQEPSQLFDELIERWVQWQQSFKARSDFHQKNQYPRQPEGVLNISSPAKYRREASQYERNREIVDRRHRRHDGQYKDKSKGIVTLSRSVATVTLPFLDNVPQVRERREMVGEHERLFLRRAVEGSKIRRLLAAARSGDMS